MPDPFSARSVSRVSNCAVKPTCSITSSGIPKSSSTVLRTSRSWGSFISIPITPVGSASISRLSIRMTICGACAAFANSLSTSPERWDFGLVRWKAWPSRSGWCAMWSIAAAT